MSEAQWLTDNRLGRMLEFLEGKINPRRLRLIACAYCLRVRELFPNQYSAHALEICTQYADGEVDETTLNGARELASLPSERHWLENLLLISEPAVKPWSRPVRQAILSACDPFLTVRTVLEIAEAITVGIKTYPYRADSWIGWGKEPKAQADLLRCVIRNPFGTVGADEAWCLWKNHTTSRLAEAIYADRAFDHLPILADALEEAGCTDAEILKHCRGPGPHVRGCWVVDLVLGKE
jgi:hypothetical protein